VSSSNWRIGNALAAWTGAVRPGSATKAIVANTAATGISDQKAARQAPSCAKMPPTAGPTRVAMPHIAEIRPTTRDQSRSAKTSRITP
jgi:hypothetical protein